MKLVLCALLMVLSSVAVNAQQSPAIMGPPMLTQEERRGEIVCAIYRQYGSPDVVTISGSSNVDFAKQDVAGCIYAVKGKMKRLEESLNQQKVQKNS